MARVSKTAFSSGEWSESLWSRIDLERYPSAVRVARNMFPRPEGGLVKRPGLEFIGFGLESLTADARLIPFKFNNDQTFMIVAQPTEVWFVTNGGVVLDDLVGTGTITLANDVNGVYANNDGDDFTYSAGDRLFILEGGYVEMVNRWVRVASSPAPTVTKVYLEDWVTGDLIDGSGFTALGDVDFGEIYYLTDTDGWFDDNSGSTPYADLPVSELDYTQANDTLYVAHRSGATKVIQRVTNNEWTCENFDPSPGVNTPTNPSISGGITGVNTVSYAITAIDPDTYEESIAVIVSDDLIDEPVENFPLTVEWDENVAQLVETFRIYRGVGGIFGLIGSVTDLDPSTDGGGLSFEDGGIVPNLSLAPPLTADFFNDDGEFPGAVELFQQRIWFGGTSLLLRDIYASRSGSLASFASSTIQVDDDPIEQAISAKAVQEVKHFVPLRDLVVLTSDAEWGFDTGDLGALSPGSGLLAQSWWGTFGVKPVLVGDAAIFVEKSGRSVRDLAYALQSDGFSSSDLSIFAKHLFRNRDVVSMCFARTPYEVLFCVMSDGQAVSCTYVRDQQIFAWARHDTRGKMLDCASVIEEGIDNIYVFVERAYEENTYRQVERMRMVDPSYLEQGVWLDNAGTYNKPNTQVFDPYDSIAKNAAVVLDGGVWKLRLEIDEGIDDEMIQFAAEPGSSLEQLDSIALRVQSVAATSGGFHTVDLYRVTDPDDSSEDVLFDPDGVLPNGFRETGTVGYVNNGVSQARYAHHLAYRGPNSTIRGDLVEYDDVEFEDGGVETVAGTHGLLHYGETYVSRMESLDIDDPTDPITGLPVTVGEVVVRFGMTTGFSIGRSRGSLVSVTLEDLRRFEDEGWDENRAYFEGPWPTTLYPWWRSDGRTVIETDDSFPLKITALVPQIEVGDQNA